MNILNAIVLGIVQGLTEFLPVSSSGHLSIFQHFMGIDGEGSLTLSVFLHIGTLVSVILVYYKTFWELILELGRTIKDVVTGKFSFKNMGESRRMLIMLIVSCLPLLILVIPVGADIRVMDVLARFSEDDDIILEGFCFLFTAFLLLYGTKVANKNKNPRTFVKTKDATAVGFAQLMAAGLPGVSRSGSTISTGMLCGVSKEYMVRYSFVLGTPAILAANLVEFKGVAKSGFDMDVLPVIIGVITSAVVGFAAIKALEWLVKTDKFKLFGYYCLVIGISVIIAGLVETFVM